MLYCTVLTALYCTALHCSTALHCTTLHYIMMCCAAMHHSALHCTLLRSSKLLRHHMCQYFYPFYTTPSAPIRNHPTCFILIILLSFLNTYHPCIYPLLFTLSSTSSTLLFCSITPYCSLPYTAHSPILPTPLYCPLPYIAHSPILLTLPYCSLSYIAHSPILLTPLYCSLSYTAHLYVALSVSTAWEVRADPRSSSTGGSPVVALVTILLPNTTHSQTYPAPSLSKMGSTPLGRDTGDEDVRGKHVERYLQSMRSCVIAADRTGVITIWDLSSMAPKAFGSKSEPSCLLRLCLCDHPAVLFRPKVAPYPPSSFSISSSSLSVMPALVGVCAYPMSTEPIPSSSSISSSPSVPKSVTDSRDSNILCVTFANGRVVVVDLLNRRLGTDY